MRPFLQKANLTVRLFFWIPLLAPAAGADEIPEAWIRELSRDQKTSPAIPDYEKELVSRIRKKILSAEAVKDPANYRGNFPGDETSMDFVFVRGGEFEMGSKTNEAGRHQDETRHRVSLSPFWIGRTEVTWGQYLPFAVRDGSDARNRNGTPKTSVRNDLSHWVTAPTGPYTDPSFGMGTDPEFPAIGMTQHAANKFCQWLSLKTGHFYRLPTEAEWEFACRAGTTGPYSCVPEELAAYAVIDPLQNRVAYEKAGSKKPNPLGLYDMHGNVMEWCLDGYSATSADVLPAQDPWFRATQRYPRVVRGGSWYDTADQARSARRHYSHPNWNMQDPQTPQSRWWLVDAIWLGFRVVRPLEIPDEADMFEAWNTGAMDLERDDIIPDVR